MKTMRHAEITREEDSKRETDKYGTDRRYKI